MDEELENEEKDEGIMPKNNNFIHFKNSNELKDFIHYAVKNGIEVGNICCNGLGVLIKNKSNSECHIIRNIFLNKK